jgi:hypothetical protein
VNDCVTYYYYSKLVVNYKKLIRDQARAKRLQEKRDLEREKEREKRRLPPKPPKVTHRPSCCHPLPATPAH